GLLDYQWTSNCETGSTQFLLFLQTSLCRVVSFFEFGRLPSGNRFSASDVQMMSGILDFFPGGRYGPVPMNWDGVEGLGPKRGNGKERQPFEHCTNVPLQADHRPKSLSINHLR